MAPRNPVNIVTGIFDSRDSPCTTSACAAMCPFKKEIDVLLRLTIINFDAFNLSPNNFYFFLLVISPDNKATNEEYSPFILFLFFGPY
jgi:hypothetical protein